MQGWLYKVNFSCQRRYWLSLVARLPGCLTSAGERTGKLSFKLKICRKKNASVIICGAHVSKEVAQFYRENRYNLYEECRNPCEKMIISTMFSYKSEGYNSIKFTLVTQIHVTKEKLKVSFDLLLGEIGGFVGMILGRLAFLMHYQISYSFSSLGVSLMDLDKFVKIINLHYRKRIHK